MDPFPPSPVHDPELDAPRQPTAREGAPLPWPQRYQRLVANPFLALFGLIVWIQAMRSALRLRSLWLVACVFLGLAAVGYLLQFHCRDCGATGPLFRWKSHACGAVRARQQGNQVRRFRGPSPVVQMVLWLYLLAGVGILAALCLRTARL